MIAMVSGHLDLSREEFRQHYIPLLDKAVSEGHSFVIGDANGADAMAQEYLRDMAVAGHLEMTQVTVYHAYKQPRNNFGFATNGDWPSQQSKDKAMTECSGYDILFIREGREDSGTARNAKRRAKLKATKS